MNKQFVQYFLVKFNVILVFTCASGTIGNLQSNCLDINIVLPSPLVALCLVSDPIVV